jgi:hypothetical protein
MNRKHVLLVSKISASSLLLQQWAATAHPFHLDVVDSDEAAIEFCHLRQVDMVVIDSTSGSVDAKKLAAVLPILQDNAVLFQYDGETSEKLTGSIEAIFNAQKYRRILNMILPEPGDSQQELPQFSLN